MKKVMLIAIASIISFDVFANSLCEVENINKSVQEIATRSDLNEWDRDQMISEKRESFERNIQACINTNKQFRPEDTVIVINEMKRRLADKVKWESRVLDIPLVGDRAAIRELTSHRATALRRIDHFNKSTKSSIEKVKRLTIVDSN